VSDVLEGGVIDLRRRCGGRRVQGTPLSVTERPQ
jgi:hypothetical protein